MPNQCIHCSEIFDDGSEEVLKGCSKCGSKFFFFLSKEKLEKIRELKEKEGESVGAENLTVKEKKQIEKDVREIAGVTDVDEPIVLDFEAVKITKPGKYFLDLSKLFSQKKPLVYKLEDGKYYIDIENNKKKEKQ